MSFRRFRIGITVELIETEIGMIHHHRTMKRVLDFDDSKTDSTREFDRLEREILKLLDKKE